MMTMITIMMMINDNNKKKLPKLADILLTIRLIKLYLKVQSIVTNLSCRNKDTAHPYLQPVLKNIKTNQLEN